MSREGWKVECNVKLPDGYEIYEDEAFVYLYTDNELVAIFTPHVSPYELEAEAVKHLNTGGAVGEEVGQERSLGVG